MWRLVVPNTREFEANPRSFAEFIDKQSGEDSGLHVRSKSLWTRFVHNQEDKLRESGNGTRFTMAENTGLQYCLGQDRSSERYVFDYHCMYDSRGKKLNPIDCVFYPSLSAKKDSFPIMKSMK